MRSTSLLILASLVVCHLTVSGGQSIPAEDEARQRETIDDIILQRAESLLLRSILQKIEDEHSPDEDSSSQPEWAAGKRQHPGRSYDEELEKRQHPGRREAEEDEDYPDAQNTQRLFIDLQRRQHPGRRSMHDGRVSGDPALLNDFSKRQHPGKRYLMLYSKRQHPGKRNAGDEAEDRDLQELDKRQHPGKRFWDNSSPDLGTNSPCDAVDPTGCSKTHLLLSLLDNVTKSRTEEKRQHPGKRLAPEEDLVEEK
ncbi:pro-thyrotropin-releasing hormone [Lampris incognitus]|uniref:pro-thyrotropin-releasing hormone n=1 Tax=Lampris incognitus TaxID=2546036 RepID=UPI0024B526CC|nr:pro-thyrotropin-releasing hormone [Lampris incognitus]